MIPEPADSSRLMVRVGHQEYASQLVWERLAPFLTPERRSKIEGVVARRWRSVVPVLENFYDRGNISAVLRSAEAFGFFQLHTIELQEKFKVSERTSKGADKWLNLHRWTSTKDCLQHLKAQGFRVLATTLDGGRPLSDVDVSGPVALVLGNEHKGISQDVVDLCDERVYLPMDGFVQSFNVSVAGALAFQDIARRKRAAHGSTGDLSSAEQLLLRAEYAVRTLDSAAEILRGFQVPNL